MVMKYRKTPKEFFKKFIKKFPEKNKLLCFSQNKQRMAKYAHRILRLFLFIAFSRQPKKLEMFVIWWFISTFIAAQLLLVTFYLISALKAVKCLQRDVKVILARSVCVFNIKKFAKFRTTSKIGVFLQVSGNCAR